MPIYKIHLVMTTLSVFGTFCERNLKTSYILELINSL